MERSFIVEVPKVFGVPITNKCHLRCGFCFNSDEIFKTATHMPLDEFKLIIDWAVSQHVRFIDLTQIGRAHV